MNINGSLTVDSYEGAWYRSRSASESQHGLVNGAVSSFDHPTSFHRSTSQHRVVESSISKAMDEIRGVSGRGRRLAKQCYAVVARRLLELCDETDKRINDLAVAISRNSVQNRSDYVVSDVKATLQELQHEIYWQLIEGLTDKISDHPPILKGMEGANDGGESVRVWICQLVELTRILIDSNISPPNHALNMVTVSNNLFQLQKSITTRTAHHVQSEVEDNLNRLRSLLEKSVSATDYMLAIEYALSRSLASCEQGIADRSPHDLLHNVIRAGRIAAYGERFALAQETKDGRASDSRVINQAIEELRKAVETVAQQTKSLAQNISNSNDVRTWRSSCNELMKAFTALRLYLTRFIDGALVLESGLNSGRHSFRSSTSGALPARPPTPKGATLRPPASPLLMSDTEAEVASIMQRKGAGDIRILSAAQGLHDAVRHWSSRENELVAEAKHMALLMAKLSQLVRGEGGTKRDLIECAKNIAESGDTMTRLANGLGRQCPNHRIRASLSEVAERIRTISSQLRMLCMIKSTMLGIQSSEDDQNSVEQLVLNAQNLMICVRETVQAAEACSIKMRAIGEGSRLKWIRKD